MTAKIARGQITIVDLNDGKSINMFLSCNQPATQLYNKDTKQYTPDYTESPFCVVSPEIYVSGSSANQIAQIKSKPVWRINNSTTLADFNATAATTSPYQLTIKKNIDTASTLTIECELIYVDPDTAAETVCKAIYTATKVENAGQTIRAIAHTPLGSVFKNGLSDFLTAHCDMWRGSSIDNTDVTYRWQRLASGVWTDITAVNAQGITGFTTNEIKIPDGAVLNFDSFKCIIKDIDTTSGTYNQEVSDIISIADMTDPYMVEIQAPAGTVLKSGMTSTTLKAEVWQGGERLPDTWFSGVSCNWKKYNKLGVQDASWGTSGVKTGRELTVTREEISVSATYIVEIIK